MSGKFTNPLEKMASRNGAILLTVIEELDEKKAYGYFILKYMEERKISFSTISLYPTLKILEAKNWITSREETESEKEERCKEGKRENEPSRRFYRITEQGKKARIAHEASQSESDLGLAPFPCPA